MYGSIQEVYNEIVAAKNAKAELSTLNSSSSVAVWKAWAWITAAAIYSLDQIFEAFKKTVDSMISSRVSHNTAWYASKMLEFQYGDTIQLINYVPQYPVIDETKRIIKRVSVDDANGVVVFKLAQEVGGELVKLTSDQLLAANSYLARIKDAGIQTFVLSQDADLFRPKLNIFYKGEIPLATMKSMVNAAMVDFLETYNSESFNGLFMEIKFIDYLQKVEGLIDVQVIQLNFKSISMGVFAPFVRVYNPESGYIKIDPAYDLDDPLNINYLPQ